MLVNNSTSPRLSRRGFLLGTAGLVGTALLPMSLTGCSRAGAGSSGAGMSFMYWGSSYEDEIIRKMLTSFQKKSGVAMRPMFTSGDQYDTKVNTLVASNTPADVAYMHDYMVYDLAEKGQLLNLYPQFDKHPQLQDRLPGTYYFWDDGKCAGNQTGTTAILMYYSKKAIKEAGLENPPAVPGSAWNWDQFVSAADKLTLDQAGRHPSDSGFDPNNIKQYGAAAFFNWWYGFVRSNGGDIANEDGTKYALDSAEAIQALQDLQDLIVKHRVAPNPKQQGAPGASGSDTSTDFRTGRVALSFDGTWAMLNLNKQKIDYGIGVMPKHQQQVTLQLSGATVIANGTKKPSDAVDFYLYHNDPHNVTELFTSGLWLPLEKKYYTNEADIRFWTDNENHPAEFRTAVIDALMTNAVTIYSQRLRNINAITQVLNPAIDRIASGSQTAAEVCKGLRDQIQPLLKGMYPNPMLGK
ncbi:MULTISPECIES: ABC transporter substrate-binding protein [unclassified Microbacterium]|uniref:ABC transporter substrate-binding protein n=1 Tax=unclassified Microbacterium TaxID=2609290 RepID=UPI003017833D